MSPMGYSQFWTYESVWHGRSCDESLLLRLFSFNGFAVLEGETVHLFSSLFMAAKPLSGFSGLLDEA